MAGYRISNTSGIALSTDNEGISIPTTNNVAGLRASGVPTGSLIFSTTDNQLYSFNGTSWVRASTSGSSGTAGTSGSSGTAGTSGSSGTAGTSGSSGTSGLQGPAGPQGAQGPQGATGPQGAQGPQGIQGPQGVQGPSGSSGTSGTSGSSGTAGTSGSSGTAGTSGTSGSSGTAGTSGSAGTAGTSGTPGTSGTSGGQGGLGPQGPQGPIGPGGPQGNTGPQGPQGPQGNAGSSGTSGTTGTSGTSGGQGPQGNQGPQGAQGPQGNTGPQGPQGPQGPGGGQGPGGSSGTSGTSAASAITNNTNNYVVTATGDGTTPFNGEANLQFNGSILTVEGNLQQKGKIYYTYDWLQEKDFGYGGGYKTLAIGSLSSSNVFSLAFGVDVSGNPSGSFSGYGSEYFWRSAGSFKTPNSSNNGYNQLFEWNSSGGMTFNQAAEFIGTVTVGSPLSVKSTTPYIQWINASSTRLAYIQHNATNLVYNADTGVHVFNQNVDINGSTLTLTPAAYSGNYKSLFATMSSAQGVLQLGNNGANYIVAGNSFAGGQMLFYVNATSSFLSSVNGTLALTLSSNAAATFSSALTVISTGNFGGGTLNGAAFIIKGANSTPATSGTTTGAVLRLSSGTGLYNVLDFGTNEALDYSWIQSTRANSLGTYDYLAIQPNGGNLLVGTTANSTFKLDVNGTARVSGVATFSSRVNVNGASDDADIALQTVAPSGAGKYIYVGRDSSAQWRFSVASSGDTQIGAPQSGATYKLLTLSSSGNNLDTGTVLRLIGNSALDLVDISVNDTTTRIYHQENAADAANGYGKIQFRTNATANGSSPTRGGFQFTIGSTDALFINSIGQATFTTTSGSGITITTNDVTTLKMTSSAGTTKNWGFATTNLAASDFGIYQSNAAGGDPISAGAAKLYFNGNGAATFSSSITVGVIPALNPSGFGYDPNGYKTLILGPTNPTGYQTLCIGVDVSGIASGAFSGAGGEIVWKNVCTWITPNAANTSYNTLLSWNSSGQFTFNQISYFSGGLTSLGSFAIGDYTQGTNTLTFAASANGIAKINFYDSNNTEGLYLRTDGEQYGGTMTLGARWDDDEAKIVFKMYQVSAGASYNARVGIGTGAINPLSMLHVCETDGGNYLGSLRVGGASGFGIVMDYTQSAATTGTMYVSPGYTSNDTLFKLGAASGNTNQLVLRGNGRIGIGTDAPSSKLQVGLDETAFISIANGGSANVTSGINWLYGSGQTNGGGIEMGAPSADNFYMIFKTRNSGSTAERMRLTNDGNLAIGVTSAPGRLTVDYTSYSSAQTPLYVGNTGFTAWNRQSYDTFVLQQDDVTSFRMVEKNGEATTNDQVLTLSIGDGLGVIATSAQPLGFYVNGSPSGLAYQGLSGTQVLRLNTTGNAQFYGALDVASTISTSGSIVSTVGGTSELRLRGGGYGGSYNTSLRSLAGAIGVLQFGNNGGNYILAGNTNTGGLLEFRVNCNSESITSGSKVLTLNANATANFESTLTAGGDIVAYSDRRLKTNVQPIKNALDKTLSLQGITYNRTDADADKSTKIGFIAQDVLDVLPEVVTHDLNSDIYGVSYGNVTALLVEAIKELSAQNKKLEEKNREFETILNSLINRQK